jgi:hypothetical protein
MLPKSSIAVRIASGNASSAMARFSTPARTGDFFPALPLSWALGGRPAGRSDFFPVSRLTPRLPEEAADGGGVSAGCIEKQKTPRSPGRLGKHFFGETAQ